MRHRMGAFFEHSVYGRPVFWLADVCSIDVLLGYGWLVRSHRAIWPPSQHGSLFHSIILFIEGNPLSQWLGWMWRSRSERLCLPQNIQRTVSIDCWATGLTQPVTSERNSHHLSVTSELPPRASLSYFRSLLNSYQWLKTLSFFSLDRRGSAYVPWRG